MIAGYEKKQKDELWKIAWINAEQYNSSGNLKKGKHVKPEDLLKLDGKQPEGTRTKDGTIDANIGVQDYDPVQPIKHLLKKADKNEWGEKPPWEMDEL